jgi:Methyltransferase TRM13
MVHCDNGRKASLKVQDVSGTEVQRLLAKLDIIWPLLPTRLPTELSVAEHANDNLGGASGKHADQEISILHHLIHEVSTQLKFVKSFSRSVPVSVHAVEFGAGIGRLSDRLQQVTKCRWSHTLVDRQTFRRQSLCDRRMQTRLRRMGSETPNTINVATTPIVQRIVGDIANFDFETDDANIGNGVIDDKGTLALSCCVSKHLCGPACDLTLAALSRVSTEGGNVHGIGSFSRRENNLKVVLDPNSASKSVCICCCVATCCHYLCTWQQFGAVSQMFWLSTGLDEADFRTCVAVSQWASMRKLDDKTAEQGDARNECVYYGHGDSIKADAAWLPDLLRLGETAGHHLSASGCVSNFEFIPAEDFERSFPRESKIRIGQRAKILIDLARAAWLQQLGFDVKLVIYTTRSIEDRLLIASLRQHS